MKIKCFQYSHLNDTYKFVGLISPMFVQMQKNI